MSLECDHKAIQQQEISIAPDHARPLSNYWLLDHADQPQRYYTINIYVYPLIIIQLVDPNNLF